MKTGLYCVLLVIILCFRGYLFDDVSITFQSSETMVPCGTIVDFTCTFLTETKRDSLKIKTGDDYLTLTSNNSEELSGEGKFKYKYNATASRRVGVNDTTFVCEDSPGGNTTSYHYLTVTKPCTCFVNGAYSNPDKEDCLECPPVEETAILKDNRDVDERCSKDEMEYSSFTNSESSKTSVACGTIVIFNCTVHTSLKRELSIKSGNEYLKVDKENSNTEELPSTNAGVGGIATVTGVVYKQTLIASKKVTVDDTRFVCEGDPGIVFYEDLTVTEPCVSGSTPRAMFGLAVTCVMLLVQRVATSVL